MADRPFMVPNKQTDERQR